ncbi:MAG TPA: FAD-dependent oxidoreductase [Syntrophomonadaceae bacterium]|nr:FAD-dependent oxidoreductase [Syntrophomonadaceae bacterium]
MFVKEKVLDLANKINGTITGQPGALTAESLEYRLIEPFLTEEMAEVALCLKMGKPQRVEMVAEKCGKPVEQVKQMLSQMAMDGIILFFTKDGIDRYALQPWIPGVYEMMVLNRENRKKYPLTRYFDEHAQHLGETVAPNVPVGHGLMRVIPVQAAVDGSSRRASYEEIMNILDKHEIFAVADCQCRLSNREHGQGCGHTVEDMCLVFGPIAPYYIRTGRGRQITKEEAFAVIEKAEREGLIHEVPNIVGPENIGAVCNCCGCGCFMLRNVTCYNVPDVVRSNYVSQVDTSKCVACGLCVENCQVNALTLGQNLCSTTISPAREKETPYDTEWGPDKWNLDYRRGKTMVAESGTSPCKTECPAHIAIQGYIKMAAQGRYREALELIKEENPFPAICGRICPRNCESECTRAEIDEPIAIDEIKKFIAEQDLTAEHRFVPKKKKEFRPEKIAVVGAGPAGLSCAYYLAVEGYQVTVFEKYPVLGGMLSLGIPSFRLEKDIINSEIDILRELGVEFQTGVEIGRDITLAELRKMGYKAFYLAIGAQASRKLGIEGEEAEGVEYGIEFLRKVNLNEELTIQGPTIVIGGGNVAIDVARTAVRICDSPVDMYCLEKREEMPALEEEIDEALAEGIVLHNTWGPQRILQENGRITGVVFKKCIAVYDEDGRFNPVFDENETITVKADNVLIAAGQEMFWGDLLQSSGVVLNPNKTVKVAELSYQTDEPDVFAGGDAVTGPRFAIDAIAMGKQGAISIHRYLHGDNLTVGREKEYRAFSKENLDLAGYDRVPRQKPLHRDATESKGAFMDLRATFSEEQVKLETERCLGCGAVVVDEYRCVGCGICTTKCKFGAISLVKKYDAQAQLGQLMPGIMKYAVERYQRIEAKKAGGNVDTNP